MQPPPGDRATDYKLTVGNDKKLSIKSLGYARLGSFELSFAFIRTKIFQQAPRCFVEKFPCQSLSTHNRGLTYRISTLVPINLQIDLLDICLQNNGHFQFQRWTPTAAKWRSKCSSSCLPSVSTTPRGTAGPWRPWNITRWADNSLSSSLNMQLPCNQKCNLFNLLQLKEFNVLSIDMIYTSDFQDPALQVQYCCGGAKACQGKRIQVRLSSLWFLIKSFICGLWHFVTFHNTHFGILLTQHILVNLHIGLHLEFSRYFKPNILLFLWSLQNCSPGLHQLPNYLHAAAEG